MKIDRDKMPAVWALDESLRSITGASILDFVEASMKGKEDDLLRRVADHASTKLKHRRIN